MSKEKLNIDPLDKNQEKLLENTKLNIKKEIDFNCDLIDLSHVDKVDLVNLKKAGPFLMHEIAQNSKLLFGNEMEYLKFKALAFRNYIDNKSTFELRDLLIKKRHKLLSNLI